MSRQLAGTTALIEEASRFSHLSDGIDREVEPPESAELDLMARVDERPLVGARDPVHSGG
jgi:hypothetical protein